MMKWQCVMQFINLKYYFSVILQQTESLQPMMYMLQVLLSNFRVLTRKIISIPCVYGSKALTLFSYSRWSSFKELERGPCVIWILNYYVLTLLLVLVPKCFVPTIICKKKQRIKSSRQLWAESFYKMQPNYTTNHQIFFSCNTGYCVGIDLMNKQFSNQLLLQ